MIYTTALWQLLNMICVGFAQIKYGRDGVRKRMDECLRAYYLISKMKCNRIQITRILQKQTMEFKTVS